MRVGVWGCSGGWWVMRSTVGTGCSAGDPPAAMPHYPAFRRRLRRVVRGPDRSAARPGCAAAVPPQTPCNGIRSRGAALARRIFTYRHNNPANAAPLHYTTPIVSGPQRCSAVPFVYSWSHSWTGAPAPAGHRHHAAAVRRLTLRFR
jgi:hypothetical protein